MKTWMTGLMMSLAAQAVAQEHVEITCADGDGQISSGEYVAYQVRIVNEGSEAAAAFQVRAILHAGLDPAQVVFDWTSHEAALVAQAVDPLTGEIRWLFIGNEAPALAAGEEAFVTFWVLPRAGTAEGTEFDTLASVEILPMSGAASGTTKRGDPGSDAIQGILTGIGNALNPGWYAQQIGDATQQWIDQRSREFQDWTQRTGQQIGDAIKGGLENLMPTENPPKNGKQTIGSCPTKKGSGGSGGGAGGCEAGGSEAGLWLAVLVMASVGLARAMR